MHKLDKRQGVARQSGMVSIIVTMILMVLISVMVIGFARITQREQRQSLDRQLNTQAFYAAESGINDVRQYLKSHPNAASITNCGGFTAAFGTTNVINSEAQTSYSCALLDTSPPDITYENINTSSSVAFPVKPASGNIDELNITWQNATTNHTYTGCTTGKAPTSFPAAGSWPAACNAGGLRIDLMPMSSLGSGSAVMLANTMNFVLYPVKSGGYTLSSTDMRTDLVSRGIHGAILGVNCATSTTVLDCSAALKGLPSEPNGYYMRIRPLYNGATVIINGVSGGGSTRFTGAQVVVDVTGKANDILKRLQARIAVGSSDSLFPFALQTIDSICKQYELTAPSTVSASSAHSSDPSCSFP